MSATLTPNLVTDDVNASVAFYRDTLGFQFLAGMPFGEGPPVDRFDDNIRLQWTMLELDGAKLMFQARSSIAREFPPLEEAAVGASATFYLEVEELDRLLARLGEAVETVLPDHVTFYGMREIWIRDNNGYLLTLAQKTQGC